ncbi:domain found in dishevelled, egl10, and pleckstrin domain containing protein [Acanthamoeba castellanii str. Neff]|uniref:Domain found in dishevelled, egl10, and pleckstrin domain containing protein n=1 Tax=Acanthamoeba castellanii (strain ATCC 30010 / Neff) TaxID=1257118 RepID=L8H8T3_ACACF|nr:domain found in dishevelled, egl10, and pleckstrin domain containing protein [Acanthamoeba castellanii str. Neff]ELR21133.1 domain found in dishevelled, egl10, and pleckstrin domain containing protein [Acanthamoeba castellanii str. Neff]
MEGIWDEKPEKLLGVVVSASLPGVKEEIYTCQVTKKLATKKKTKEWEKFISKESSWPQFFFAVPDSSNLELTITDKSGKVAGTYEIKVDDLKQDTVVAGEYELQVSDKKKKKAGESDDPQGKVDVRVYYSLLMETRPPGPGPHTYNYADYLGQIKTGDLVVYSGTGVLAAACQLITNTPYSHIGLAVYLPNRWTQEPELYIVELTKNFNRFQDAFKEVAESGINIFRFKERVHQYHGNSPVWWVPLKESLSPVHQQVLVEWIWKMHRGDQAIEDNIPPISVSKMTEFLTSRFKITVSYDVMLDFYSPAFVYKALGLAGALEEDMTKYSEGLFASDVVKLPCFGAPVQIRYKADDTRVAGTQASSLAAGFAAASANKDGGRAKSGSMDGLPPVTGEPAARPRLGTAIGTPTKLGGSAASASPPGSQILPNPAAAAGGAAVPRRPQPAVPPRGAPPSIVHTATAGGVAGGVAAAAASVARNRPPSQTISSPLSAITQSHSPSNSSTGVMTKPGLGSAKTSLAAPPPLVAPSSLPAFAPTPVPAPLENREKRREKMMTLSRKFGTSRLAVTSLGIEGDFNSDEKAENAIDAIVAKMRGPGGIPMADINWQGKNYTKCFLGCDAVDWMLKCKVATTRDQAVELANEILVTGRLYHLSRRMAFIDGMEIYRFEARSPFRTRHTRHMIADALDGGRP